MYLCVYVFLVLHLVLHFGLTRSVLKIFYRLILLYICAREGDPED